MAITQLSSPDVLAPVGARSYWVASGNPIIFTYQRKDLAVISVTQGPAVAGVTKIKVSVASVPSDLQAGQKVYISNFGYTGTYVVINKSVGSFVLDATWTGNQTGGFCNLVEARNAYYMDVNVYALTLPEVFVGNFRFYDNSAGVVTVDLQGAIDSHMDFDQQYDYTKINDRDYGGSFAFDFEYRESWRGHTPVAYSARSTPYFALKATKQIGDVYGSNMRAYVPDIATDPVFEEYIAKFLTMFERPVYFEGFPFTISFLYNHTLGPYNLIRKEQEKDLNGNNSGSETSATLLYQPRTYLNRLNNRKGYDSDIHAFEIWLEQGSEIDFGGAGYGTGTGGGGASTDYFAEDYDENWGS